MVKASIIALHQRIAEEALRVPAKHRSQLVFSGYQMLQSVEGHLCHAIRPGSGVSWFQAQSCGCTSRHTHSWSISWQKLPLKHLLLLHLLHPYNSAMDSLLVVPNTRSITPSKTLRIEAMKPDIEATNRNHRVAPRHTIPLVMSDNLVASSTHRIINETRLNFKPKPHQNMLSKRDNTWL